MGNQKDNTSLWACTSGAPPLRAQPLCGALESDIVVVGGGFTGCSAALHAAQRGADVCLLEACTIGHGGSGRNVGLVNAGLWLEPKRVENTLGPDAGARLNRALAGGPGKVFSLVEKHGIECDVTRTGTLHCAHSRAGLAILRKRLRQYRDLGGCVDLLSAHETALRTGTKRYLGALLDHRAGTLQPLAYVRGLASAAIGAGAGLFEHSPVTTLTRRNGKWVVQTEQGLVRAGALVLATNAYHEGLEHRAAPSYTALNYFQIATSPLDEDIAGSILTERQGAWDTMKVMSSFRVDAHGRLVLGTIGSLDGPGRHAHLNWARNRLGDLFPGVADCDIEYAWSGRMAMTSDHLPRIVRFGERALSVYGYSGRGIAPGTLFGACVAEYLLTGNRDELPLVPIAAPHDQFPVYRQRWYELGATLFHWLDAHLPVRG